MGNIHSRTTPAGGNGGGGQDENANNSGNNNMRPFERPLAMMLALMQSMSHRRSAEASGAQPPREMAGTPESIISNGSGHRYNLRRSVTRVRREQQQRRSPTPSNVRENSGSGPSPLVTSTGGGPAETGNNQASADMLHSGQQPNIGEDRRRPRPDGESDGEAQAQRPRIADGNLFGRLNLGGDEAAAGGDNGQSLYFTFPWNTAGSRYLVLVRVRHLAQDPANPAANTQNETNGINGVLQWTLFFLMPQAAAGEAAGSVPENLSVDPAQVLTEAFAAFNSLISENAMSYEEMTRLQEMMGFVSRGVGKEAIDAQLESFKYAEESGAASGTTPCSICLTKYQTDDVCRKLPCSHSYHAECIDKWLNQVNQCPLCRREAVSKDAKGEPATMDSPVIPPEDLD